MKRKIFILAFLLSNLYFFSYCQLTVNYVSATQFVQRFVGPNVSFTNAVFSGTSSVQMAKFSGATSPNIGIPMGIMLATGDAMVAEDISNNCSAGSALGGGGDADLSGACQQPTRDLAAVEFDFWVPTDSIALTFMFASEEYNYWVNSKNDVCGARLYNAGGGYANVLYLPGTFTPVCVNKVNKGSVANICDPATGPCMNCAYYNDNPNGTTFQYNGYTDLLTIKFHVTPCDTFHFWIGIADAQDYIYDSAILLPEDGFIGVGTSSGGCTPLPIELISFTGKAFDDKNILYWSTASEINNNYFTLLKSNDGNNFNPIAKINGSGNSTQTLNYSFTDTKPLAGINYYQLKQTDYNGEYSLSKIITVKNTNGAANDLIVSPNPAHNKLTVSVDAPLTPEGEQINIHLTLIDVTGRVLLSESRNGNAGLNNYDLSLANFAKGIYTLEMRSATESRKVKVVVE